MKVDSLKELEAAFAKWRRRKKYAREPVPEKLLSRAQRAAKEHGLPAVVRVTRVERARLRQEAAVGGSGREMTSQRARKAKAASADVAKFSRLELSAPSKPSVRPLAEIETTTGVRLRVFEETPEMLRLLSAACGCGGSR